MSKSIIEKAEIAAFCRDLMNNPIFTGILSSMENDAIQVLRSEPVGSLTAAGAHASMKAVESIRQHMVILMNDEMVARKRG